MSERLKNIRDVIASREQDALGIAGSHGTCWAIRDEVVDSLTKAIEEHAALESSFAAARTVEDRLAELLVRVVDVWDDATQDLGHVQEVIDAIRAEPRVVERMKRRGK